ncbi:hypothetical protein D9M70_453600 [compost metagenome]
MQEQKEGDEDAECELKQDGPEGRSACKRHIGDGSRQFLEFSYERWGVMSEVLPVGRNALANDRQALDPVGRHRRPLFQDVRNRFGNSLYIVHERGHKERKGCCQDKDDQHRHYRRGSWAISSDGTFALAVERPGRETDHRSPQQSRQEGPEDQGATDHQQGKRACTENRPYPSARI